MEERLRRKRKDVRRHNNSNWLPSPKPNKRGMYSWLKPISNEESGLHSPASQFTSADFTCLYPLLDGCDSYKLSAYIKNQSSESISALSAGCLLSKRVRVPGPVPTRPKRKNGFAYVPAIP